MNNNKLPERKTIRKRGFDYNARGVYFLTICTLNRKCILSRIIGISLSDGMHLDDTIVDLTDFGKIADKYLKQIDEFYDNIFIDKYVIMPNHIHIMLRYTESGPSGTPVPTTVQNSVVSRFVSTFKRFCNKEFGMDIWQRGSYDHIIRDNDDYVRHKNYILENPRLWHLDEMYCEE